MKKCVGFYLGFLITVPVCLCFFACNRKSYSKVETGVPFSLATHRAQTVSKVEYAIELEIPGKKTDPIRASSSITFHWKKNRLPLQIDFKEQQDNLQMILVNGKKIPIVFEKEHVLVSPRFLRQGMNHVFILFIAGDLSLNRSDEYLYTLLVPDRARTVFPCFDQPDIKAPFGLTLTVPREWNALSNAPLRVSGASSVSKSFRYEVSDSISTYLFSFAAGKFDVVSREINGRMMHFYHRETDTARIRHSLDTIFGIHGDALAFMEDYTNIPFPFKKFDFIAIPDFQYGGMEHVGAIQYRASTLFLDKGATRDQELDRSGLIAHETAHMWFGNLVTMRWFNDVWMKEVFANFMADKINTYTRLKSGDTARGTLPGNEALEFLLDHYPASYSIDRTAGAHPVRQELSNLENAGSLYGNIIYHKAPIVMRQLEMLMGKENLRNGLRAYLLRYAGGNASWPDLIEVLDPFKEVDLRSWNQLWVEKPGRPQFSFSLPRAGENAGQLKISQAGEEGEPGTWPQLFDLLFVYPGHEELYIVQMNTQEVIVNEITGKPMPLYILFNANGYGYGVFPVDSNMVSNLGRLKKPVYRASAYINLYENMLNGRFIAPHRLLDLFRSRLSEEPEELNVKLITGYISEIFWRFISSEERTRLAPQLESALWQSLVHQENNNIKKLLFKCYQGISLTKYAQDKLYMTWKDQSPPTGVHLSEHDYTSLALSLAVRDYPSAGILQGQLARISNPDRRKRMVFLMPAIDSSVTVRDRFFLSLRDQKNREKESWVTAALQYLHHPLRVSTSVKYLQTSLELLGEIQSTGDIFFPQSWLQASLSGHQSPEAARVVQTFLKAHPGYDLKLRSKILQAADGLFRAQKLVASEK